MSSATRKVLVCGSTGFIGRNVAERLAAREDLEVHGTYFSSEPLRHPRIRPVRVDLRDPAQAAHAVEGMDAVIQAAATTSGSKDIVNSPFLHVTDNAIMNSALFRAAHERGVGHVVFFSCSVMYDSSDRPVRESDFVPERIHPRYFGVAWTKVYIEKMAEFYAGLGRTRYSVLRHSNIYGPHDKFDLEKSHVFGATVAKVMAATDKVVVWGDGTEARDLLYVSDLVDYVELALARQSSAFDLSNVGAGRATTINELVSKIIAASGKNLRIEHDASKPSIKTSLSLDCSKARSALGWSPRVTLEEGIEKTLAWYRASKS